MRRQSDGNRGASQSAGVFYGDCGGCSYVVDSENVRTRAATPFVHDGGGDTDAIASSRRVAEKRLFVDHADSSAGGEGIKISPTALSGYMAKFARPAEEAPVRGARRERPQSSTSASHTRGTFAMKPDTTL